MPNDTPSPSEEPESVAPVEPPENRFQRWLAERKRQHQLAERIRRYHLAERVRSYQFAVRKRRYHLVWLSVAAVLTSLLVLLAEFVEWDPFSFESPESNGWWLALGVPVIIVSLIAIANLITHEGRASDQGSFSATLLGQAPIMIGLASSVTIGLYLLPEKQFVWFQGRGDIAALLVGAGVALLFGTFIAFPKSDFSASNNINPDIYGVLQSEFQGLDARVAAYCATAGSEDAKPLKSASCALAREHRDVIASELGLPTSEKPKVSPKPTSGARWVLGTGYIDMWHRLHAADEALFVVKPCTELVGDGLHDVMRLKDSRIVNSVEHIDRLRTAIAIFGAERYLATPPPVPFVRKSPITDEDRDQARIVMQQVRHVINQYRDDRREGLVRTRNELLLTGTLTGVISLLLLGLIVICQVRDSILVAAVVFYLVGALVGLFSQLNSGWGDAGATEEDYGLNQTRLVFTPMLSGLAAIGGVLLSSMLYASLSGPILPTQADGSADSAVTIAVPQLYEIFNLNEGRFGLVIAAVFGLTPSLLINRLKGEADKYKTDLQTSNAQGNQ